VIWCRQKEEVLMGYWREDYPKEAEEHDRKLERIARLKKKLESVKLGEFPVLELGPLMKVLELGYSNILTGPSESDLEIIEARVRAIEVTGEDDEGGPCGMTV
jgi:hypothetical protein